MITSVQNLQHYKASVLDLDEIYFSLGQQPWTLPSNTALTVGPKIDYVLVKRSINIPFFNEFDFG
jgi:isoleucyl-tRNA synthetase